MTYIPCGGTGREATNTRVMHSDSPKFAHLNGKTAGHCPECGRSLTLGRSITATPRHKEATS